MTLLLSLIIHLCLLFIVETEWVHLHLSQKYLIDTQQRDTLFYMTEDNLLAIQQSLQHSTAPYAGCLIPWNADPNYYTKTPPTSVCHHTTTPPFTFSFWIEILTLNSEILYRITLQGENKNIPQHATIFLQKVLNLKERPLSWREF